MTRDPQTVHDLVGIGIGPFGLGLAALAEPLPDVDAVFLDRAPGFQWHPGMMLEGATIQVPFLADLVTMADPTSRYSFLAYLKDVGRLYPFYIRESFYPLRSEYDDYCRWVAHRLPSLRWGRRVVSVSHDPDEDAFVVRAERLAADGSVTGEEVHRGRHVVLGVGSAPAMPPTLQGLAEQAAESPEAAPVLHSAQYLPNRERLVSSRSITVLGSGQSAAEIYRDLLDDIHERGFRLDWITRSPRFFPMEYTKLSLELTSPEYTDHHRALPAELRDRLAREQRALHKGISAALVDDIHEALYRRSSGGRHLPTTLRASTEVIDARHDASTGEHVLALRHTQSGAVTEHRTHAVVAALGYRPRTPRFLDPLGDMVRRDSRGRLDVARDYTLDDAGRLHAMNAEEHTHGVTAPDLGFGPWRASVVLANVTGREPYPIEPRIAFQTFGTPEPGSPDAPTETVLPRTTGTRTTATTGAHR
ncbi:lysine N(6)-hydroxylase/L-ornithine N(5)-oxygenase family protein [Microbacterium marinilacus]|uniref:L-lysine N6-monooxygenase MbtG n=1 Tax=Microbacterium marinilacus TaxID=415209 RepID=A0ABP7BPI6_9MICO|nr:SidA/IucD/PvdA family monooxygenase [Microbacterium marinilacus]MBY0689902.1 SidA/IucD/PvdA family monooxygenase [Microbacterium marinilacus]